MLWNLAVRTLLFDRGKLVAGLVGVIFSVVLVNMQGGLFLGLMRKASILVEKSNADVWIGHRGMHNVDFTHQIPMRWIHRVRSVPGVEAAEPFRITFSEISLPGGGFEDVAVIGVSNGSELGKAFEIVEGPQDALTAVDGVIVDQCDNEKLKGVKIGDLREIGGNQVRIAGKGNGVLSFLVTPYIFTTHQRSARITNADPASTSYILVKVEDGHDIQQVCKAIRQRLPETDVMLSQQYAETSVNFWMTRTGIGLSFGAATLMGLLVGLVMVAQTLYAMVLDRIGEFATLKAIGSSEWEIVTLLFGQATLIAVAGIFIGTVLSFLGERILSTPQAEITIPLKLYIVSGLLVLAICWSASALPYLRVRRVSPHSVLQGT